MANGYMPRPDFAAMSWMQIFSAGLIEHPDLYHVTPVEAAYVADAVSRFADAYRLAVEPGTRTSGAIAGKDQLRMLAEERCRPFYARIKSDPGISNEMKINIGVRPINSARSRIGPPQTAPILRFHGNTSDVHQLTFADVESPFRSAKPFGAIGLQIFRALGTGRAESVEQAEYLDTFTRQLITIRYGAMDDLKIATYFGRWINRRGETGPWSRQIFCRVNSVTPYLQHNLAA